MEVEACGAALVQEDGATVGQPIDTMVGETLATLVVLAAGATVG